MNAAMKIAIMFAQVSAVAMGGELVVFSRDGCQPCEAFKSMLEESPETADGNRIVFAEADSKLWKQLGVSATPTFLLFNDGGELVKKKVGYRSRRDFERWMRR